MRPGYHDGELRTALDPTDPMHSLPPLQPQHKTILDVGCGMGQTLFGLKLPEDVIAYGVDPDWRAIERGRTMMPPNITLYQGRGESLPFTDSLFDLVICRISLPYMRVNQALAEMHRVLKPGGDLWIELHPPKMTWQRIGGAFKEMALGVYVLANGFLFNSFGWQLPFRAETYQTDSGMAKAFDRAGLSLGPVFRNQRHYIIRGNK